MFTILGYLANGQFDTTVAAAQAMLDAPAYATTAAPTVPDAIRALAARGRHRVAVASYFTAPGRFATESAEAAPWIAST